MKSYRKSAAKLQRALLTKGRKIRLSMYQFYSDKRNDMIDTYVLTEGKTELLKTCSMPEVVRFLAAEFKKENDDGADG